MELAGITPSVGAVGCAYDNALAETINGLYKTEVIHRKKLWTDVSDVEMATLTWVEWFNHRRLFGSNDYRPPMDVAAEFYWQQSSQAMAA